MNRPAATRTRRAARTAAGAVATLLAVLAGAAVLVAAGAVAARAGVLPQTATLKTSRPPQDLNTVINNITKWVVGIVASLATLCLTIGGLRYLLAGGDPGEVSKAKDTLKYAAIGYGTAILAPLLVQILKGFVGG